MSLGDTTSRRRVLRLSGTALAAAVGAGTASGDHFHPEVSTDPATNVGSLEATLNGTLNDTGNADTVDVWFEYDLEGFGLTRTSSSQTLTSTGSFSETVAVGSNTTYEFRAVADNGSAVEKGSILTFETEDGCCPEA